MSHKPKIALIAAGANARSPVGEPLLTIKTALKAVSDAGWHVLATSRFYRTPAFPPGAGDDYVNAAFSVKVTDGASAESLLQDLHRIEAAMGRERLQRWGSRTLDLDLIAWGDRIAPDLEALDHWMTLPPEAQTRTAPTELILPHPRVQDRSFVLVPLADIAPEWTHPVLGQTTREMLAARPDAEKAEVVPIGV